MAKQKYVNGSKKVLKELNDLMKDLDKKASIKVGIIGSKAYEKQAHSDLTMAQLGAIHEFGAEIPVTDKMRAYLHHIGVHLKPETTTITIPARSFLRDTFFNDQAKERLLNIADLKQQSDYLRGETFLGKKVSAREANLENYQIEIGENPEFFMNVCKAIGALALEMVQVAFYTGGFPDQWAPITQITKDNRIGSPSNPPLTDTGDLANSISVEVKEL